MTPRAVPGTERHAASDTDAAPHEKGNVAMGLALDILKTAALVGANLVQNQVQQGPQAPEKPGIMDMLKKNASKVFGLLFLRDVVRSLLVTMFLGLAAMAATATLDNEGLFRAASFFTLAVFLLVCVLTGVAAAMVKTLGFHKETKDSQAQGTHQQVDTRELEAALDRAYSEGYAQGRLQAQGAAPAFGQPRSHGASAAPATAQGNHAPRAGIPAGNLTQGAQAQNSVPSAQSTARNTQAFGPSQGTMRPAPQASPQGQAGFQGNTHPSPNSDAPRH